MKRLLRRCFDIGARTIFRIVLLPVLYILKPLWHYRFAMLQYARIGEFVGNVDLFLRRLDLGWIPDTRVHIFFSGPPSNRELLRKISQRVTVIQNGWLVRFYDAIQDILAGTPFFEPIQMDAKEHYEFSVGPPSFSYVPGADDTRRGIDELQKMGIGPTDWYVCFHSRDAEYLKSWTHAGDTSRHDFRNSDVKNYLAAAEYVASLGGYAIRMGARVSEPLPDDMHPRIIDYATKFRSDFLDIFLTATCTFFVGNSSGLVLVALAFGRRVAFSNYCPYPVTGLGRDTFFIPKLLRDVKSSQILSFPECARRGLFDPPEQDMGTYHRSSFYEQQGYEWIENSPEDLRDLFEDMMDSARGKSVPEDAVGLQIKYNKLYTGPNRSDFAGRLGPRFAKKYRNLIVE